LRPLQLGWAEGVCVVIGDKIITFDSRSNLNSRGTGFISHAHGDHLHNLSGDGSTYTTPQTLDMARSLMKVGKRRFFTHEIGHRVKLDEVEVTIHNAGHMLGSAQFCIHTPTQTVAYTGDINCRDMFTTNAAEKVECDLLVLETTYGNPFYVFPDLAQTSAEMVEWTVREIRHGRTPVFRVYSSGKPQEIIRIFNIFTNIPVVTDGRIAATTNVYIKNRIPLCYLSCETREGKKALDSGEAVFITSSEVPAEEKRNISVATATGWALNGRQNFRSHSFPLSSHADFRQLVQYVEEIKPKEVLTLHGFKEDFASYIQRKLNVTARPLPPIEQRILREYL